MAAPVKAKKVKSTSNHEPATNMSKESTEERTPPNKKNKTVAHKGKDAQWPDYPWCH